MSQRPRSNSGDATPTIHDLTAAGLVQTPRSTTRPPAPRPVPAPVDDLCLARASTIGCDHGVCTLHAIHLAAAARLPRPVAFLTFDQRQAAAGRDLGLDVTV